MRIEFIKDHLDHKQGDVVDSHPNADYLVSVNVAKEAEEFNPETVEALEKLKELIKQPIEVIKSGKGSKKK